MNGGIESDFSANVILKLECAWQAVGTVSH